MESLAALGGIFVFMLIVFAAGGFWLLSRWPRREAPPPSSEQEERIGKIEADSKSYQAIARVLGERTRERKEELERQYEFHARGRGSRESE